MTATDKNPSYLENMIVAIENAIMAIPDFEGPMPDELWELLQAAHRDGRRDLVEDSYRRAAHMTKLDAVALVRNLFESSDLARGN